MGFRPWRQWCVPTRRQPSPNSVQFGAQLTVPVSRIAASPQKGQVIQAVECLRKFDCMRLAQLGEIAEVMDVREFDLLRRKDGLQRLLDRLLRMKSMIASVTEPTDGIARAAAASSPARSSSSRARSADSAITRRDLHPRPARHGQGSRAHHATRGHGSRSPRSLPLGQADRVEPCSAEPTPQPHPRPRAQRQGNPHRCAVRLHHGRGSRTGSPEPLALHPIGADLPPRSMRRQPRA
jgi:hypothetical protein